MHPFVQPPKLSSTLAMLGIMLCALPAWSAASYMDLSLEQLLQIQVSSVSKKQEAVSDAPAAIYVITGADIERSGVTTIPDALRLAPGVEVARADSNSWAITIRGFNSTLSNKLLVLVDGRTIYNPVFGGVLWEAHNLMLEDIDRIEVIRGPGGTLWGANAVNGVINITTRHTRETQNTLVSTIYGNEEKGTVSARHGGSLGDNATYRVYAKAFKQDSALKASADTANPREDNFDEWNGFLTGMRIDWDDRFTLQGDAYRTNAQQLRPYYSYITPLALNLEQTLVYEGVNILGRWTDARENGSQLSLQGYIDWAKRDEPYNFIDDRTTLDLELQYNFAPLARHEIISGGGLRALFHDKKGNDNVAFSPARSSNHIFNAFLQDKITLVPEAWFLTLGAKMEHNEYSSWEFKPNARLQWRGEDQTLWLSSSRAVRTPTPLERNLTGTIATAQDVRVAFVPNEEFRSEKLIAYELGYRNEITPNISVDIATFYNEYDRLMTFRVLAPVPVDDVDSPHTLLPVIFTNEMEGTTTGAEIVVEWEVSRNIHFSTNYSYLHMSLTAIDPTQESAERLSPRHQFGTRLFWDSLGNWTFGASAKYIDKLPANNIDDYVRLDVNLGIKISNALKFNLVGQNLLESSHREFGSINDINAAEIERSIFGKLTWQF